MAEPLNIALAGLGTVGGGVLRLIEANAALIERRAGRPIRVTAISARDRSKDRGVDLSAYAWEDDMTAMAARPDVDVVVELVGGSDGPALTLARNAISHGKSLVTANKAMIAHHGLHLAELSEQAKVALKFEAAVAGGVPVIKGLREGAAANKIERLYGILNGTCNFILSTMEDTGRDFADVLAEAQAKGYAEADPTMDVGGFDAAHKISILAALAFRCAPTFAAAEIEGIDQVALLDIRMAKDLGYRIKLVASAERSAHGALVRVHPTLAPLDHPLARAGGALNALFIEGERTGRIFVQGPGAGAAPTAAAVAADIADVIAGGVRPVFQAPAASLAPFDPIDPSRMMGRAYLRFLVKDEPGVIAAVSETLAEAGVSSESFLQKPVEDTEGVPIVLTTHAVAESVLTAAVERIAGLSAVLERPRLLRIARI
jgi:homoserine dehydrogenase